MTKCTYVLKYVVYKKLCFSLKVKSTIVETAKQSALKIHLFKCSLEIKFQRVFDYETRLDCFAVSMRV